MSLLAALQLPTLPMSEAKLDYYALVCHKKNIKIIVLGEYVLNSFFKELEKMPKTMIQEQSKRQIETLRHISQKYSLIIIAPIVRVRGEKIEKYVAKCTPKSIRYYPQFFLLNFKHWNEERFFDNNVPKFDLPTFTHNEIKYAILFGYELFFDYVWQFVDKKKIDVVLLPCVSTFGSIQRWQEILKMRALTHNVYILRVNRIGNYKQKDTNWHFYGHTLLVNPHGEVEEFLDDKEAIMISKIEKQKLAEARQTWQWSKILRKKGL